MAGSFEPKIIVFCCQWCSYAAADLAGSMRLQYPPNIRIIKVPCTGRVDVLHILHAFECGAEKFSPTSKSCSRYSTPKALNI